VLERSVSTVESVGVHVSKPDEQQGCRVRKPEIACQQEGLTQCLQRRLDDGPVSGGRVGPGSGLARGGGHERPEFGIGEPRGGSRRPQRVFELASCPLVPRDVLRAVAMSSSERIVRRFLTGSAGPAGRSNRDSSRTAHQRPSHGSRRRRLPPVPAGRLRRPARQDGRLPVADPPVQGRSRQASRGSFASSPGHVQRA